MAFTEADGNSGSSNDGKGLPLEWSRLEDGACPKCGDELVDFNNVLLKKCLCGFKISYDRFEKIVSSRMNEGFNGGYRFGNYDDEPPF